jgi:UbiD family decarboxylase
VRNSDVLVPAAAEMILEGEILPRERTAEGPFGEFTGYSLGERQREPLCKYERSPTGMMRCFKILPSGISTT